jgi:hypothetical protein
MKGVKVIFSKTVKVDPKYLVRVFELESGEHEN